MTVEYRANSAESTNNITTQLGGTTGTFSKGPCPAPSPRASPSSPESEITGSETPQDREEMGSKSHEPITDASQDDRFDTFFKRLIWFKGKKESDEAFSCRIGIPFSRFKGWKYRGHAPKLEDVVRISDILDVSAAWLAVGRGHRSTLAPGGRVIEIPREPYFIYDDIDQEGDNYEHTITVSDFRGN